MNLYIGNLSSDVTDGDLQQAFEVFGEVKSAKVLKDTYTGKSRGFGFVEMWARDEAQKAISSLNGQELKGQRIKVNEARPQRNRERGGYGRH